jgi:predicted SAM-dependent methyltransferase
MKQQILSLLRKIRATIVLVIKPKRNYFLFAVPTRSLEPISHKYGFDRGTPVDRYYIEQFLQEHQGDIAGHCLEVTDPTYTKRFGAGRVTQSDVVDINVKNEMATIIADLRDARDIKDNTYDCVIATHTFGVIDEYQKAIAECYRILKPGGVLLSTVASLGVAAELNLSYWRFTTTSARYAFGKIFSPDHVVVQSYGNVLSGQAYWVGLSTHELTEEELAHNDPRYSIVVGIRAVK